MSQTVPENRRVLSGVHALGHQDLPAMLGLLQRNRRLNVFVQHRVEVTGLREHQLGGRIWGYFKAGELVAACHAGANVVPIEASPTAIDALAERIVADGRRAASVVGPDVQTARLWQRLEPHWGPARSARTVQPFLALSADPLRAPDPRVRRVAIDELGLLYPACVAMFREEIGVDPEACGALNYRARVAQLIAIGWAFAIIENDTVLFKAEVGAATAECAHLQGVWTHPSIRGTGRSAAALAAVVQQVRESIAPVVTLYVNDYNVAARALYARVGFEQIATFSSYHL